MVLSETTFSTIVFPFQNMLQKIQILGTKKPSRYWKIFGKKILKVPVFFSRYLAQKTQNKRGKTCFSADIWAKSFQDTVEKQSLQVLGTKDLSKYSIFSRYLSPNIFQGTRRICSSRYPKKNIVPQDTWRKKNHKIQGKYVFFADIWSNIFSSSYWRKNIVAPSAQCKKILKVFTGFWFQILGPKLVLKILEEKHVLFQDTWHKISSRYLLKTCFSQDTCRQKLFKVLEEFPLRSKQTKFSPKQ